ncbi:MAG: hypothetical protein ACJ0Q8_11655, partial [Candidatus Azotimanducaceae bacterium]
RGAAGVSGGPAIYHWPALIDSQKITEHVHIGGKSIEVLPTQRLGLEDIYYQQHPASIKPAPTGPTQRIPFGRLFGTRSGDKGGNANVGVWALTDESYSFLYEYLTVEEFKRLVPDFGAFEVERYDMPNLLAMNFYIKGVLGTGAASNHRIDKQAKSLGEYLRAKYIEVPEILAKDIA